MVTKRTKPVNIRVSENDFERFREVCKKAGKRNVSDLAREALRLIIDERRSALMIARDTNGCLDELAGRLTHLQIEVKRLRTLLTKNA
jgi:ribbon-helix-helix CopG family protein